MLLENLFLNNPQNASARSVSETSLYKYHHDHNVKALRGAANNNNNNPNNLNNPNNPKNNLRRYNNYNNIELFSEASLRSTSHWDISRKHKADFLIEASLGLISHAPELCPDGTGGTYFLKDSHNKTVAVFKPREEDPLCRLNPKHKDLDSPLHLKGIRPGEGVLREVLAYQLAPEVFRVPETHTIDMSHTVFHDPSKPRSSVKRRRGSLQKFISGAVTAEEVGSSLFSTLDVQSIALLDILMVNCDRNGGNILVKPGSYRLVPIDHSFSLPDYHNLLDLQWFEWMNYRQSKEPLVDSLQEFVKNIDIHLWVEKARDLHIRPDCIITMRLAHAFLIKGLSFGKTLFEIGKLMCSPNPKNPSVFVNLVARAQSKSLTHQELLQRFVLSVSEYFSLH